MTMQIAPESGSLVDVAMRAVNEHIVSEGLRVGDTVPGEAYFTAKLGVSRGVMREAFGALAALKLIDVGNGRKPRVAAIDGSVFATSLGHAVNTAQITVPEVWDVRRTIELRTVELAAANATRDEALQIVGLARAMAEAKDDMSAITRHDIDFHLTIARASHNLLFLQIVTSFAPLMQIAVPTAWQTRRTAAERRAIIRRHGDLAETIQRGDAAAAVALMSSHFDTAIGDMLRASQ